MTPSIEFKINNIFNFYHNDKIIVSFDSFKYVLEEFFLLKRDDFLHGKNKKNYKGFCIAVIDDTNGAGTVINFYFDKKKINVVFDNVELNKFVRRLISSIQKKIFNARKDFNLLNANLIKGE